MLHATCNSPTANPRQFEQGPPVNPIEDILQEARAGRMFILTDAEERENEGDLIIPAQHCHAAQVNFMATHGRGLICLALTAHRAHQLHLSPLTSHSPATHAPPLHGTAFTIPIDARTGITTGISAYDRARTIAVAIDPQATAADLVSPGHMFPLIGAEGGVLTRAGHTEAALDIARLAGLQPAAVICEIMHDDGSMARLPQLLAFARTHHLKIATIADLITFLRQNTSHPAHPQTATAP